MKNDKMKNDKKVKDIKLEGVVQTLLFILGELLISDSIEYFDIEKERTIQDIYSGLPKVISHQFWLGEQTISIRTKMKAGINKRANLIVKYGKDKKTIRTIAVKILTPAEIKKQKIKEQKEMDKELESIEYE